MVAFCEEGMVQAEVARLFRVSRATVSKWWRRYQAEPEGFWYEDRSSRPYSCPHQTPVEVEEAIVAQRRIHQLGPARIGYRLGVPSSTVWKVLSRRGLNRLALMDRTSGRLVRRYEKASPGELIHLDTKQVASISEGGGWRVYGLDGTLERNQARKSRAGYQHVHAAVDDHSRVAYAEILPDIKAETCARFWERAHQWFTDQGITIQAVMTDNGSGYRSNTFKTALNGVDHVRTRPYRPQTNGKVERFNRTLVDEWVYARIYTSNQDRTQALADWIHTYNHHRGHTAIGGPPISRVNNQGGSNT
jgi:transposase InsO family protein